MNLLEKHPESEQSVMIRNMGNAFPAIAAIGSKLVHASDDNSLMRVEIPLSKVTKTMSAASLAAFNMPLSMPGT